jgi:cobalt-precorrin 5A hydrolase
VRHKTVDPAVVVMDERGHYAVSLLSGHLGGANRLARQAAAAVGADPVITTATDVNDLPSIDTAAQRLGLAIENPDAIRQVNMAILVGDPVALLDPMGAIPAGEPETAAVRWRPAASIHDFRKTSAGVYVDDRTADLPPTVLVLRPPSLAAGIGCNRGTPAGEIRELLLQVLARHRLSPASLRTIASVDLKQDETGLIEAARSLHLPLTFYPRERLSGVSAIENPSATVEKHIGVKSVCEAAAILAAGTGTLIVPKTRTRNVTVALARAAYSSSASARGA